MFKLPSEETASVEHQPRGGTFFVAPVVTGIEAEAEVLLFDSHAEVRANLDVVGEGEVVGALGAREADAAVDLTFGTTANVKFGLTLKPLASNALATFAPIGNSTVVALASLTEAPWPLS